MSTSTLTAAQPTLEQALETIDTLLTRIDQLSPAPAPTGLSLALQIGPRSAQPNNWNMFGMGAAVDTYPLTGSSFAHDFSQPTPFEIVAFPEAGKSLGVPLVPGDGLGRFFDVQVVLAPGAVANIVGATRFKPTDLVATFKDVAGTPPVLDATSPRIGQGDAGQMLLFFRFNVTGDSDFTQVKITGELPALPEIGAGTFVVAQGSYVGGTQTVRANPGAARALTVD